MRDQNLLSAAVRRFHICVILLLLRLKIRVNRLSWKKKKNVQAAHNNIATFRLRWFWLPSGVHAASLLSVRAGRELFKHAENSGAHKETKVSSKTQRCPRCSWNSRRKHPERRRGSGKRETGILGVSSMKGRRDNEAISRWSVWSMEATRCLMWSGAEVQSIFIGIRHSD